MTILRARAFALALLATGLVACDPGPGSSHGPDTADDDDGNDGSDDGSDDPGDVYIRALDIGDFTWSETLVYTWGECTTTRTLEGEGNGDCSVGTLGVGVPQPDGSKVAGGLGLCGSLTITDVTTPASCDFDDTVTMEKTAVGQLALAAPNADDPMTLTSKHDCPEFTLSTTVVAASALKSIGATQTFVLDASVDADCDSGTLHRELHAQVDVVVAQ